MKNKISSFRGYLSPAQVELSWVWAGVGLRLTNKQMNMAWFIGHMAYLVFKILNIFLLRRDPPQKKLRKFGHMSKLGVPYLPCSLVWTKMNLDKYSSVYPTYLPKKFGHFGPKVCYWILKNLITFFFWRLPFYTWRKTQCSYLNILTLTETVGVWTGKKRDFNAADALVSK